MAKLIPKITSEESWQPLVQHRDYALLCPSSESVFFRVGQGRGMYLSIDPFAGMRAVNNVDFETGEPSLLGKLPLETKTILGRTSDCSIKVLNPLISRQHMELTQQNNVLMVRDLGSTNGTYVLKQIKHFDIQEYLENHPLEGAQESTIDWVHEAFGPEIDQFLKSYSQSKKETN